MNENQNINQLPKDWSYIKLGDALDIQGGSQPPKSNFIYEPKEDYIQLLQIRDFGERGVPTYVPKNKVTKFCKKEDIMIARYGASLGRIMTGLEGAYNVAMAKVIDEKKLFERRYIFYLLKTPVFQTPLKLLSRSAQNGFSKSEISHIELPLPPKPTQEAIVSKIEELFSELDKGIEQLKTAQQQLKIYRQSVLKWAFEGKLTNENLKDGELPEGWKWERLGDVSKVSGGISKTPKRNELPVRRPFLRVANVYFNRLDLSEIHTIGLSKSEVEKVTLLKDDLLFVEGNGSIEQIGRVALWNGEIEKCVHQNHLIKSRLSENVLPKYALYFYCSKNGRDKIKIQAQSTSGLHTLSLSKISKLELPTCSINEQLQIVQEIESRLSVADKMEESITQSLQQAEALRQSILKKAFEGRLT